MAAGVNAVLYQGLLIVQGTAGDDQVFVDVRAQPGGRRGPRGFVQVNGGQRFPAAAIKAIAVGTAGGNDVIIINDNGRPLAPVFIDAGDGNDIVLGGSGVEAILGGEGNDILVGRGGAQEILIGGGGMNAVNGVLEGVPAPAPAPVPVAVAPSPVTHPTIVPTPAPAPTPAPTPVTPAPSPTPTPATPLDAWAQQIVDLTNVERQKVGLPPLRVNAQLSQAATIQAGQMARLNRMAHTLAEADYPDLASRGEAVGYRYAWLGENIAYNYPDPEGVVRGWMLSTGHRENILNTNYTEIGVAVAYNAEGRPYYAQVFGRPL